MVRSESENDLVEELGERHRPEAIAEGLVAAASRPRNDQSIYIDLAFARQAMLLDGPPCRLEIELLADRLASAIAAHQPEKGETWTWELQLVPPDSRKVRDVRRKFAEKSKDALLEALLPRLSEEVREARVERGADRLVQVWPIDEERALVGVTTAAEAITTSPGGKVRMRRPDDAPSRAGLKLEEAIGWIGIGPDKGDLCVDLGAAPGGWSQVAVKRGATVIAVDPARMKVDLPKTRFTHVQLNAFEFAPSETLDWLLCDMAWRPLEVAALVAKWGRRVWARQLIANFKLPMKKKAEMMSRVREILETGGWKGVRARQLYFDRDEVTVFAWLDPHVARKGAQAPFQVRSKKRHEDREQVPRRRQRT
jgi:23S rRNA (cytidine2498-2'-O)-methyltransferase